MILIPVWAKGESSPPTWADKMLSERTFDFGTLTPDAEPSHTIRISNIYKETVTITDVAVASADFEATVDKRELASRETSILTIRPKRVRSQIPAPRRSHSR